MTEHTTDAGGVEYTIEATDVEKAFGENKVLRGVSFKVATGTATAII